VTPSARYQPLLAVVFLVAALWFIHATLVSGQVDTRNANTAAWDAAAAQKETLRQMKAADDDLAQFHARLPKQTDLPKMVAFVSETAEAHRLPIPSVTYDHEEVEAPGLTAVSISFDVTGDYLDVRHFINALERSDLFLVIQQLTLTAANGEADNDRVRLQIRMTAYMQKADAPDRNRAKQNPGRIG